MLNRIYRKIAVLAFAAVGFLTGSVNSNAATVTFENGTLVGNTYIENGMEFDFYGDAHLAPFAGGNALTIGTNADVLIYLVDHGQFSLDSLEILGPNYTVLLGWVSPYNHVGGVSNNADVGLDMSAVGPYTVYPASQINPVWGNMAELDFCGYCKTSFGAAGGMDNLNFTALAAAPEPSKWAMMLIGFVGLGFVVVLRRKRFTLRQAES